MHKFLPNISTEELEEIKLLSSLFFSPREIAIILEYNAVEFIDQCEIEGSAIFNSFYGGRLSSEKDLRDRIIKLAKSGSSPAQTMALEMLNKSVIKIMDK